MYYIYKINMLEKDTFIIPEPADRMPDTQTDTFIVTLPLFDAELSQSEVQENDQVINKYEQHLRDLLDRCKMNDEEAPIGAVIGDRVGKILNSDSYSAASLDGLIAINRELALHNETLGIEHDGHYDLLRTIMDTVSAAKLRDAYYFKNGDKDSALKTIAQEAVAYGSGNDHEVTQLARLLTQVTGLNAIDMQRQATDADRVVKDFVDSPQYKERMIEFIELIEKADFPTPELYNNAVEKYRKDCLRHVIGFSAENEQEDKQYDYLVDEMMFASHQRLLEYSSHKDQFGNELDAKKARLFLDEIDGRVGRFGVDSLYELRQKAGIVNFDYYSKKQLMDTLAVVRGRDEIGGLLQAGDTTVVMNDAKGDYNGALGRSATIYSKPSGRTVFFEINQPSDVYRHFLQLEKLGVKPSTFVLAVHGMPGSASFGDGNSAFTVMSREASYRISGGDNDVVIDEAAGLERIAKRFMQPSRAIDDPQEQEGRIRVILNSCSSTVGLEDSGRHARKRQPHIGSVALSLAKKINAPNVDVIGGDDVVAPRTLEGDNSRLEFISVYSDKPSMIKFSQDNGGNYRTEHIDSLPLYRRKDKQKQTFGSSR